MKLHKYLLLVSTAGAIAATGTPSFSQSSSNGNVPFRCNTKQDILITEVYNPENDKSIPLIYWKNNYIDSQNLQSDCESAAKKMQSRYLEGKLHFSAVSQDGNNQFVFCLINAPGESCAVSNYELFRLKPTNVQEVRTALLEVIDPNLAPLNINELRLGGRTYPKLKSKRWPSLLGILGIKASDKRS